MSPVRASTYAFLILVLLGLAGWGIFQVIGTQDEPQVIGAQTEPTEPKALTREEEDALFDEAIARARSAVEEFIASGANACGLEAVDRPGHRTPLCQNLEELINDVDLIVEGDFAASSMMITGPNAAVAEISTDFNIREVLLGSTSAETIVVNAGGGVMQNGGEIIRIGNPDLDQCSGDHVLLFLDESVDGRFGVVGQGFATIEDGAVDEGRASDLFTPDIPIDQLKADIRRIASDQLANGVPKGRLVCASWRERGDHPDTDPCPGDSFNPYEAFGLARVLEVDISSRGADNQLADARGDVPTDTPALVNMLALLNRTVTIEPGDDPVGDVISLKVITTTTGTRPYSVSLKYEIATGSIWVSGGRFPAPEGFGEALEAILQGS